MNTKTSQFVILTAGWFLFCLDQFLKHTARLHQDFTWYLWKPYLGWEYFGNTGVAFSLPIPAAVMAVVTPFLIGGLLWFAIKRNLLHTRWAQGGILLILEGAISNYTDRILYGVTVDYIHIATGIINLADLMIVAGVFILFKSTQSRE